MVRLSLFGRARRRTRGGQGEASVGAPSRLLPAILLLAATPAKADEVERWRPMIEEASTRFGIPTSWIERVMRAESRGLTMLNGRPIRSSAGAMGLMQLMPATWADMRARLGLGRNQIGRAPGGER